MLKLIEKLDSFNLKWKESTILLMDNAAFHRIKVIAELIDKFHLPLMFLGPYSYHMAPVEELFAVMKKKDLNPDNFAIKSK